jgi:hypothetical protein
LTVKTISAFSPSFSDNVSEVLPKSYADKEKIDICVIDSSPEHELDFDVVMSDIMAIEDVKSRNLDPEPPPAGGVADVEMRLLDYSGDLISDPQTVDNGSEVAVNSAAKAITPLMAPLEKPDHSSDLSYQSASLVSSASHEQTVSTPIDSQRQNEAEDMEDGHRTPGGGDTRRSDGDGTRDTVNRGDIIFVPAQPPPSRDDITRTLLDHGLSEMPAAVPHCSDASDLPAHPRLVPNSTESVSVVSQFFVVNKEHSIVIISLFRHVGGSVIHVHSMLVS